MSGASLAPRPTARPTLARPGAGRPDAQNPAAPRTGENAGSTSDAEWHRRVEYRPMRRDDQPPPGTRRMVMTPTTISSRGARHPPPSRGRRGERAAARPSIPGGGSPPGMRRTAEVSKAIPTALYSCGAAFKRACHVGRVRRTAGEPVPAIEAIVPPYTPLSSPGRDPRGRPRPARHCRCVANGAAREATAARTSDWPWPVAPAHDARAGRNIIGQARVEPAR